MCWLTYKMLTRKIFSCYMIISYEEYEKLDNEKPNLLDKLQALKNEYADAVDDLDCSNSSV